jgi:hypothetical protein
VEQSVIRPPDEVLGGFYSGVDSRYRLWTVGHVPFDVVPGLALGGPLLVGLAGWVVRVEAVDGGYVVDALRDVPVLPGLQERSPLGEVVHGSVRDAERAAYEAGLCAFLVHETDRYRYGLGATAPAS